MGNIVLLDDLTINQIAAGEVIERPASVVKEMLENSIDAGAKNITVEIKDGGNTLIRITDDGCGIAPDDMEIAFERHATSKIRTSKDLDTVMTMGFRGEALASIAAIARVEMVSKRAEDKIGNRVIIRGGDLEVFEEAGSPNGTTIVVEDLFYNTPVRYKFLKKDYTEAGYIEDVVTNAALVNNNIAFTLINNGRTVIHTNGNGDEKTVVYSIFGKEVADNIIPVDYTFDDITITGFVGNGSIAKSSRSNQVFFVNGRNVKDKTLTAAVDQAFKNTLPAGKFAFLALNLEMDPKLVDVNVHPSKLEIRFQDESTVFRAVHHAILNAIEDEREEEKEVVKEKAKKEEFVKEDLDVEIEEEVKKDEEPVEVKEDMGYVRYDENVDKVEVTDNVEEAQAQMEKVTESTIEEMQEKEEFVKEDLDEKQDDEKDEEVKEDVVEESKDSDAASKKIAEYREREAIKRKDLLEKYRSVAAPEVQDAEKRLTDYMKNKSEDHTQKTVAELIASAKRNIQTLGKTLDEKDVDSDIMKYMNEEEQEVSEEVQEKTNYLDEKEDLDEKIESNEEPVEVKEDMGYVRYDENVDKDVESKEIEVVEEVSETSVTTEVEKEEFFAEDTITKSPSMTDTQVMEALKKPVSDETQIMKPDELKNSRETMVIESVREEASKETQVLDTVKLDPKEETQSVSVLDHLTKSDTQELNINEENKDLQGTMLSSKSEEEKPDNSSIITDRLIQEKLQSDMYDTQFVNTNAVREALNNQESLPKGFEEMYKKTFGVEIVEARKEREKEEKETSIADDFTVASTENQTLFDTEEGSSIPTYRYVGLLFEDYIIIEIKNEMYIVDSIKANERLIYDNLKKNYYTEEKDSTMLLLPDVITLNTKQMYNSRENIELFEKAGFKYEEFGENTIKLTYVPAICEKLNTKQLFIEMLNSIEKIAITDIEEKEEKFIEIIANGLAREDKFDLDDDTAKEMIDSLLQLDNPLGNQDKPVAIKMTRYDLERKFSRR